jgi:hypothetical protein
MFTFTQYRAKEEEYRQRGAQAHSDAEIREFKALERSFSELARNEDWLSRNFDKTVRAPEKAWNPPDHAAIADSEEHILRCLGAAVIMQWNIIPTKLRRELFDSAGSMGDVLRAGDLRGQIARFLHAHRDHAPSPLTTSFENPPAP